MAGDVDWSRRSDQRADYDQARTDAHAHAQNRAEKRNRKLGNYDVTHTAGVRL